MLVLALWVMYVLGRPLVIGTAQNLDTAEEVWQAAVDIAQGVDELAEEIEHVSKVNGKKFLELKTGERYKVAAASRRGGRGLSGDLVLLDELHEHQTWDAWSAVSEDHSRPGSGSGVGRVERRRCVVDRAALVAEDRSSASRGPGSSVRARQRHVRGGRGRAG